MSVLIKGITFPRKPDQITVTFRFNDPTGDVTHTHYMTPDEIVEVPTPHGRLIDADELEADTEWSERQDDYTAFSRAQINTAPIIIEAEEVEA